VSGLTVALSTTKRTMHVTRQVQDLQFRTVIPGGYASCSISLHRPLNLTPDELAFYGRLYVYDGRNGNTVWEGRVEDLGRASDSGGENWSINAVGPMAHAQDQNVPLLYQVTDLSGWQEDHDGPAWMARNTISTSTFGPGLQMFAPRDTVVPVGYYQGWRFTPYLDSGIGLAQVTLHYGEDVTDANWQWSMNFAGFSHAFTAGSSAAKTVTLATDFTGPYSVQCTLGLTRTTSSVTVANDTTAASFTNIILRSTLFDRTGAEQVTAAPYSTPLKASNVVVDLLGRMLPLYDGVNAFIDTTTDYTFTGQLAYPDGTT
jgi:hypothetical protein